MTGVASDAPGTPAGLLRDRLVQRFVDPSGYAVGRIVAPAGSGKSRLLGHIAQSYNGPVAWCGSPDPVPRNEVNFLAWIYGAIAPYVVGDGTVPATIDSLIGAKPAMEAGPLLVVLDDVHLLEDSDAESALSELVSRLPRWMRLLVAARVNPNVDMSRLSVSGMLIDIGQDDLRFRTWEIEELFRNVYEDPLVPEDVGALARRTGGWAAYLQLFHLATARKPQRIRRQVIASLSSQTRLVHEYLSRHVLAELSPDLHDFLIRTSVLRRPTPELCDELLGWQGGSAEHLLELERRHLFTERGADGSYRYHTVLLSYLDALLIETDGIASAREQHRRAAEMLERAGFSEDALAAYAKSEDWESVGRVLWRSDGSDASASPASAGSAWLEALPSTVVSGDSLLLMAHGRLAVARGALDEAVRILKESEAVAGSSAIAVRCREERERVTMWRSRDRVEVGDSSDWVALLRAATQRNPSSIQRRGAQRGGVRGRIVEGLAALMAGEVRVADRVLRGVAAHPEAPAWVAAAAHLAATGASVAAGGTPELAAFERLREEVELAGVPWLNRITSAALTGGAGAGDVTRRVVEACERDGDRWGAALVSFLRGTAALSDGSLEEAVTLLDSSAGLFTDLEAPVLALTARGFHALALWRRGSNDDARRSAVAAQTLSGALDVAGASAVSTLVVGLVDGRSGLIDEAQAALEQLGSWDLVSRLKGKAGGLAGEDTESPGRPAHVGTIHVIPTNGKHAGVTLRCLGGFSLAFDGHEVDESAAKPMERALLHLLALRAGEKIHREDILEALWPEAEPDAGRHRLQVAVSALRRLLGEGPGGTQHLVRDGDAYGLSLPEGSDVDMWRIERGVRVAADARNRGDDAGEQAALEEVVNAYCGPLLPMDGPADWVVGRRQALSDIVADAATRLASLRIAAGDLQGAADALRVGLAIDRFRDELWNMSIDVAEMAGHHADALRARRAYADMLLELGLTGVHSNAPESAAV